MGRKSKTKVEFSRDDIKFAQEVEHVLKKLPKVKKQDYVKQHTDDVEKQLNDDIAEQTSSVLNALKSKQDRFKRGNVKGKWSKKHANQIDHVNEQLEALQERYQGLSAKHTTDYNSEENIDKQVLNAYKSVETSRDKNKRIAKYNEIETDSVLRFSDLPLTRLMKTALQQADFEKPTRIQLETIKACLMGRHVIGSARTGSGKTLAFLIPILERLWNMGFTDLDGLGALIVTPTRELAMQIFLELDKINIQHKFCIGLLVGGQNLEQESTYIQDLNIVVGTPGRILQHLDSDMAFNARNVKILVLDEADLLMHPDFKNEMTRLIDHLPPKRQTLLFSATNPAYLNVLDRLGINFFKNKRSRDKNDLDTTNQEAVDDNNKTDSCNDTPTVNNDDVGSDLSDGELERQQHDWAKIELILTKKAGKKRNSVNIVDSFEDALTEPPVYVSVFGGNCRIDGSMSSGSILSPKLMQTYIEVTLKDKLSSLFSVLQWHIQRLYKILVFTATCNEARFLSETYDRLTKRRYPIYCLTGKMNQKKRRTVYAKFSELNPREVRLGTALFATNLASRGLDMNRVGLVVQYDLPENEEAYIHRVGRTARLNNRGTSIMFVNKDTNEPKMVEKLYDKGIKIDKRNVKKFSEEGPRRDGRVEFSKRIKWMRPDCYLNVMRDILVREPEVRLLAQRAIVAYVKDIYNMADKSVFDVSKLDLDSLATSYGLLVTPRIRFLQRKAKAGHKNKTNVANDADDDDEPLFQVVERKIVDKTNTKMKFEYSDDETSNNESKIKSEDESEISDEEEKYEPEGEDVWENLGAQKLMDNDDIKEEEEVVADMKEEKKGKKKKKELEEKGDAILNIKKLEKLMFKRRLEDKLERRKHLSRLDEESEYGFEPEGYKEARKREKYEEEMVEDDDNFDMPDFSWLPDPDKVRKQDNEDNMDVPSKRPKLDDANNLEENEFERDINTNTAEEYAKFLLKR